MKLKHKCGIFGLYTLSANNNIILDTIKGLENLQHRGREAAGICYINNLNELTIYKNLGLVKDVFKKNTFNDNNTKSSCIGHVRYSTTKKKIYTNKIDEYNTIQPLWSVCDLGEFSLVHNGNIPNIDNMVKILNINLKTDTDSEIFIQLIQNTKYKTLEERLINIIDTIPGVYSLIVQTTNAIYGLKDRFGIRPLCLAKKNGKFCLSSESSYLADCDYIRELKCGELIKIDNTGDITIYIKDNVKPNFCLFELIYFMKHTSVINDNANETYRYIFGQKLGKIEDIIEYGQKDIFVTDVPNTAIPSAQGYASSLNIKYMSVFEKKAGTGRTFILPNNTQRYTTNRIGLKIRDNVDLTQCKSIILVDDSLVRGNTIRNIIKKIKDYGITTIHLRIPAPPIRNACYYGIDIPTREELIAYNRNVDEIAQILGITSLRYLDYKLMSSMFENKVCGCCFTGEYDKELIDF